MRVLLNYSLAEKPYVGMVAAILKRHGVAAISTAKTLTITTMNETAAQMKCNAVLCVNEKTLANIVEGDKPTLDDWRGSRLDYSVPVIVCNKLEHLHKVPHGQWLFEQDLGKIRYVNRKPEPFHMQVLDAPSKYPDALQDIKDSILVAFDIETNGEEIDKYNSSAAGKRAKADETLEVAPIFMTCVSYTCVRQDLSFMTYVVPLVDFDTCHWRLDDEYAAAFSFIREACATDTPKAMQNGMYDALHSCGYRIWINNWVVDTMLASHAQYSELPKDLAFIASWTLFDYRQWKYNSKAAYSTRNIEQYWRYNGLDTFYTARIALQQLQNMPRYASVNYGTTFPMVYPCLYSAFEGFLIDNKVRKSLLAKAEDQLLDARHLLQTMTADPCFNPGSWQQKEKLFYTVIGAKKPGIGKSKSCTDKKNLSAIAQQHPLIARYTTEVERYQDSSKAIGTYYKFWQRNERLLYNLNPGGTETGRMSCNASSFNCGTQVQNIPGYAKYMLVPDAGFAIIDADFSKAEAVCTAYLSQCASLIRALSDPDRDFYRTLGTLFFSIPYEEVSTSFRNKVLKKIVHGTNYMMGAQTFIENAGEENLYYGAEILGITLTPIPQRGREDQMTMMQFATLLLNSYHDPFPEVRLWYEQIKAELIATSRLVSPLGHTRHFFGDPHRSHSVLRSAVAHRPQNLSVSILNAAMLDVYKKMVPKYRGDFRLKGQVHDSIISQGRIERLPPMLADLRQCMTRKVLVHGKTMEIGVDFAVSTKSWKEGVELQNGLLPEVF
jgi:DNA polymerase I-like protein with 3'-5' exonuclease and polymerase domains